MAVRDVRAPEGRCENHNLRAVLITALEPCSYCAFSTAFLGTRPLSVAYQLWNAFTNQSLAAPHRPSKGVPWLTPQIRIGYTAPASCF